MNSNGSANNNNANNSNLLAPFGYIWNEIEKQYRAKLHYQIQEKITLRKLNQCHGSACKTMQMTGQTKELYVIKYEEVFSLENLFDVGKECCKNVRWKSSTQMFELNMASWIANLHNALMNDKYKTKKFTEFDIMERGKVRHIKALHISDRCVQKCLCKYCLRPLLVPKLIYDNSANIDGKGTEFALNRLKKHLIQHYKKHGRKGGILLIDYHDYFGSINHQKLLKMLKKDIPDKKLFNETAKHIRAYSGEKGLGLGSETSQILAVYYTNPIDHYIKEQLHIKGYGRYMDDCYLIHEDIDYLKYCLSKIEELSVELGLTLNSKTKICEFSDGFTYLKKRFLITENGKIVVQLSRENIKRRRQTLKKMGKKNVPKDEMQESYLCWRGYANHYNTHYTVENMDKLFFRCSHGEK